MGSEPITAEELNDALAWIDDKLEAKGINIEAEAERDRHRKVEIYDDFCHVNTGLRVLHIPQPTIGFLLLYKERRTYFEDDGHGLGRLLVALGRMKEPGYIRALRMGGDIPDAEADETLKGVYAEDKAEYYLAIEAADKHGQTETEKKTMLLLELRTGLCSGLMGHLLKPLNSPDILSTNLSTECISAPSEI